MRKVRNGSGEGGRGKGEGAERKGMEGNGREEGEKGRREGGRECACGHKKSPTARIARATGHGQRRAYSARSGHCGGGGSGGTIGPSGSGFVAVSSGHWGGDGYGSVGIATQTVMMRLLTQY